MFKLRDGIENQRLPKTPKKFVSYKF